MIVLSALRKYWLSDGREEPVSVASSQDERQDQGQLPFPGFDRLNEKHLIADLSKHSQTELAAIDTYERSHKKRQVVFDKLRYLQGSEPIENYDALGVTEILAAIEGADLATLEKTRAYERKFQRRPDVLEGVDRLHRKRREERPPAPPEGYQPASARQDTAF
jgi:hypothetical protein